MRNHTLLHIIFIQRNNRFLVLLISLVLFFALYPIVEDYLVASLILNLFFMLIILSGVLAVSDTPRPLLISLILALLTIVFRWIHYFYQLDLWSLCEHGISIIFLFYIAVRMLKFILGQSVITHELIYAAIAVYFIFGLAWASIYQVLEVSHTHSFSISTAEKSVQNPATMSARVFVVLEAIMGQFYLAILIANLVGRRIAQEKS